MDGPLAGVYGELGGEVDWSLTCSTDAQTEQHLVIRYIGGGGGELCTEKINIMYFVVNLLIYSLMFQQTRKWGRQGRSFPSINKPCHYG